MCLQELPADDEELDEGQALPVVDAAAEEEEEEEEEEAKEPEVLRTKTFFLEPMTQEEALEQARG